MKIYDNTLSLPIDQFDTIRMPIIVAPIPPPPLAACGPTQPATSHSMRETVRRAWGHLAASVARMRGIDKALMAVGTPAPLDGPATVEVPIIRPSGQASHREVRVALGLAVGLLALCLALIFAASLTPPATAQAHGPITTAAHWHTILPCSHYDKHHPLKRGQVCSTLPTSITKPCSSYDHWHPAPASLNCPPPKTYPCSHYNQWHPAPSWQGCPAPKGGK